jgi:hypothetical protein
MRILVTLSEELADYIMNKGGAGGVGIYPLLYPQIFLAR